MFEELANDIKLIKEYFLETSFAFAVDVSWSGDEALDVLKGRESKACVKEGGRKSEKYENIVYGEDLSRLAGYADCAVSRNALCRTADPASFIKSCRAVLKDGGFFILSDTVADMEDAYLNAAEFVRDAGHVRFYTVKEIINWAEGIFRLEYYKRAEKVMSLNTWRGGSPVSVETLSEELEKFPEAVQKELNFIRSNSGSLLGFTMKTGLFIFRALPEIG